MPIRKGGFKLGEKAPESGIYTVCGPRGGIHREVTTPKGHVFLLTAINASIYALKRPTHNKSGEP